MAKLKPLTRVGWYHYWHRVHILDINDMPICGRFSSKVYNVANFKGLSPSARDCICKRCEKEWIKD